MAPSLLNPLAEVPRVSWFNLSFIGWLVVVIALGLIAYRYDVPAFWIGVGALLLIGIGIIASAKQSRPRF